MRFGSLSRRAWLLRKFNAAFNNALLVLRRPLDTRT